MRIIFDQGTPVPLRFALPDHEVATAYELGWSRFENGELISAAEAAGFEVLVTTDSNLKYQQNLAERRIAIVVLVSSSWPRVQHVIEQVVSGINTASPGSYLEIPIP